MYPNMSKTYAWQSATTLESLQNVQTTLAIIILRVQPHSIVQTILFFWALGIPFYFIICTKYYQGEKEVHEPGLAGKLQCIKVANNPSSYSNPGCIPCKLYAGDTPTLTIDSIVICQTPRRRSPNFCARNAPWTVTH